MSKPTIVIVGIILLAGIFFLASKPAEQENTAFADNNPSTIHKSSTDIDTINQEISQGSLLIDVRTAEEYAAGHIRDAQLFPLADIESGSTPNIDKEKNLYVYCRSGNRSAEAKKLLEAAGFTSVIDLGGQEDVVALGGIIVR